MRQLLTLAMSLGIVASAAAQGQGEIIIRRPGVPDRVIRLDSAAGKEELAKVQAQLREMSTTIEPRLKELQGKLKGSVEEASRMKTLALRESELPSMELMAPFMQTTIASARRQPHLGVQVSVEPRETDKFGAAIISVTPGSPAERAGILSGDVITRLAGKSLAAKDSKEESNPGLRLISLIATLTVGKPVDVELRRGTQTVNVKVTPVEDGTSSGMIARIAPSMTDIPRIQTDRLNGLNGELALRPTPTAPQQYNVFTNGNGGAFSYSFNTNGLFANIELTSLNEKLGAYFGTTEGVLVVNVGAPRDVMLMPSMAVAGGRGGFGGGVARGGAGAIAGPVRDSVVRKIVADSAAAARRAPSLSVRGSRVDSLVTYIDGVPVPRRTPFTMGLEPGDVIVSVDGRKVTNPSQLMRIVGTYDHNDEFKLQIMRQKRSETLTVKMP